MKLIFLIAILGLTGCHSGDLGEFCNPNGSCNSGSLECAQHGTCVIKRSETSGLKYESQLFCASCTESCGSAGMKSCAFSDPSVWGSKPSTCECR